MSWRASYSGYCRGCGEGFCKGDQIDFLNEGRTGPVGHEECANMVEEPMRPLTKICPTHFLELSATAECEMCLD